MFRRYFVKVKYSVTNPEIQLQLCHWFINKISTKQQN